MGDIYTFKTTNSFSRDKLNYDNGLVKNIHYGDIHSKFQTAFDVTMEEVPYVNSNILIKRIPKENYCQEGDLVMADASEDLSDIGKSIEIVKLNNEKILAGLHTILARPNLEKLTKGFGGYLFQSREVRRQVQKESQGAKVLGVSPIRLSNIYLCYPIKNEQKKISNLLTLIDKRVCRLFGGVV